MRFFKFILPLLSLLLIASSALAAATYNDKYMLQTDTGFQHRVRQSLVNTCAQINSEGWAVAIHEQRMRYCVAILNSPDTYAGLFATAVANDGNVISDATANGTVVLSSGNVATQAALVTDAHIDVAISSQFNSFLVPLSK